MQRWASRVLGMPDRVTAIAFDNAVMTFGVWADNRLAEFDSNGKPVWTLDQLLDPAPEEEMVLQGGNAAAMMFFSMLTGGKKG